LLQLSQDDLDEGDIAAYSATVRDDADSYKTLSQQETDQAEKEKLLKKQLADKKKKLKAMKAKKVKDDKAKKAAAAKKKSAAKNKKSKSSAKVSAKNASAKNVVETPFPEDEVAMKSYSQAIAQQAENNEPDAPVDYDGQAPAEKMTNKNDVDEDADKEISQLLLGVVSKKGKGGGLFPGSELIQLNAEGLEGLFDDDDDQTAVQTG
jgi:hypothetical protein